MKTSKSTSTSSTSRNKAMTSTSNTVLTFAIASIFVSALYASPFSNTVNAQSFFQTYSQSQTQTVGVTTSQQVFDAPTINWPEIEAESAFVYDPVGNKIIFEKNADTQRPTASLLKIMTAATADNIFSGQPKLIEKELSIVNMKNDVPVDFSLATNSKWSPSELTQIMLLGSSNKAAETIASQIIPRSSFISLMNFNARRMGLTKTYFRNPSGLTLDTKASSTVGRLDVAAGVTTAREMAKMMWNVIAENPGLLNITGKESITIRETTPGSKKTEVVVENTNQILKNFPILFSKTGYTENSGGNIAMVLQKSVTSHPYVIVVLGSSKDGRFSDATKLASTTLQLIDLSQAN